MNDRLKPFFTYLGGKHLLSAFLPPPEHGTIIEPFAGSAGYATRHSSRKVVLYDVDPTIAGVWDYLIKAKSKEILKLKVGIEHVDEIRSCQEARHLVGFWLSKGIARPATRPSPRMVKTDTPKRAWQHRPRSHWGPEIRERIASQVDAIKHWKIYNQSYEAVEPVEATYCVDPPYQVAGTSYRFGSKLIDYGKLGAWCVALRGTVIVCENFGASWLPFQEFRRSKSTHHGGSTTNAEALYIQRNGRDQTKPWVLRAA